MKTSHFTQTNLRGVLERADDILADLKHLQVEPDLCMDLADRMVDRAYKAKDTWESAAWALVRIELLERMVRDDDKTVEEYPKGWNGGMPNDIQEKAAKDFGLDRAVAP